MTADSSNPSGALVLFSGGQDSTTCLAWALDRYSQVETVGFDYSQRHAIELECRKRVRAEIGRRFSAWGERLGPDHFIDITSFGAIGRTALTSNAEIEMLASGLPSTFVPGRNLVFFVYAAALGYRRGLRTLVGGMCETDYSGYPDCRDTTLKALQEAIRLGTEVPFTIETPLMWRTKAETWALAHELGGDALVDLILEETHTCYRGERGQRHDWGYGCGTCPACELRAKGYAEWRTASSAGTAASTLRAGK
ncbi:MAG: 7-cyano-7-deazaguanine synthase QueC [Actinomycetota bacterium]